MRTKRQAKISHIISNSRYLDFKLKPSRALSQMNLLWTRKSIIFVLWTRYIVKCYYYLRPSKRETSGICLHRVGTSFWALKGKIRTLEEQNKGIVIVIGYECLSLRRKNKSTRYNNIRICFLHRVSWKVHSYRVRSAHLLGGNHTIGFRRVESSGFGW